MSLLFFLRSAVCYVLQYVEWMFDFDLFAFQGIQLIENGMICRCSLIHLYYVQRNAHNSHGFRILSVKGGFLVNLL